MTRNSTLLIILVVALLGLAAQAMPEDDATAEAPPATPLDQPAPDPAPEPAPGDDPPALGLDLPEPNNQCYAGWCSADWQCEKWYGPGSTCRLAPGATCGHCD